MVICPVDGAMHLFEQLGPVVEEGTQCVGLKWKLNHYEPNANRIIP